VQVAMTERRRCPPSWTIKDRAPASSSRTETRKHLLTSTMRTIPTGGRWQPARRNADNVAKLPGADRCGRLLANPNARIDPTALTSLRKVFSPSTHRMPAIKTQRALTMRTNT
jgi:hypothetical protein